MKTVKRTGIFETNSSSSHSISLGSGNKLVLLSPNIKYYKYEDLVDVVEDMSNENVYVYDYGESGEYGWEFETYHSTETKLDYIMIDLFYKYDQDLEKDLEKLKKSEEVSLLKEVIKDVCDLDFVIINTHKSEREWNTISGYIDHQSIETTYDLFDRKEDLVNYLFNPNSTLETGNDNG